MLVRELRWGDFDDLVANYFALYKEREEGRSIGITLFDKPPTLSDEVGWFGGLFGRVQEGRTLAVVGDVGGHAVALCTVDPKGGRTGTEVSHVGVLGILIAQAHRNKGLGRLVMTEMIRQCRGKFDSLELQVFANNEPARHLYTSLGFQVAGCIPRGIKRGGQFIDDVFMVLPLQGLSPPPPT